MREGGAFKRRTVVTHSGAIVTSASASTADIATAAAASQRMRSDVNITAAGVADDDLNDAMVDSEFLDAAAVLLQHSNLVSTHNSAPGDGSASSPPSPHPSATLDVSAFVTVSVALQCFPCQWLPSRRSPASYAHLSPRALGRYRLMAGQSWSRRGSHLLLHLKHYRHLLQHRCTLQSRFHHSRHLIFAGLRQHLWAHRSSLCSTAYQFPRLL
jgi:hypothetical protein